MSEYAPYPAVMTHSMSSPEALGLILSHDVMPTFGHACGVPKPLSITIMLSPQNLPVIRVCDSDARKFCTRQLGSKIKSMDIPIGQVSTVQVFVFAIRCVSVLGFLSLRNNPFCYTAAKNCLPLLGSVDSFEIGFLLDGFTRPCHAATSASFATLSPCCRWQTVCWTIFPRTWRTTWARSLWTSRLPSM